MGGYHSGQGGEKGNNAKNELNKLRRGGGGGGVQKVWNDKRKGKKGLNTNYRNIYTRSSH